MNSAIDGHLPLAKQCFLPANGCQLEKQTKQYQQHHAGRKSQRPKLMS